MYMPVKPSEIGYDRPMPPAKAAPRSAPARRNARGEGERLREDLLAAALDLLDETGDASALTVRAVTKRAGVSPMAMYLHFDDREALLVAVCDRAFEAFRTAVFEGAAADGDPASRFRAAGEAYVRFALEHQAEYRTIFQLGLVAERKHELPEGHGAFEALVALVQACMDAGQAPVRDPWPVSCVIWAAMHGLVTLRCSSPDFPWPPTEDLLEEISTDLLGLEPLPAAS
jgi:AcrR family transcriptional regulator